MNFTKTALTPDAFALAYSQVALGLTSDAFAFDEMVNERGEGEENFCADLLAHVRALAYAANILSDEFDFQAVDVARDIYQAFGRLIIERDADFEDITMSSSGALESVCDWIRDNLNGLDTLSCYAYANAFKRAYLAAFPVGFDDLASLTLPTGLEPFVVDGTTYKPLAFNVESVSGESLDADVAESLRGEYDWYSDEDFNDANFFDLGDVWYDVNDFLRCDSIFGTVGVYGESATCQLLMVPDASGDGFHIVRSAN